MKAHVKKLQKLLDHTNMDQNVSNIHVRKNLSSFESEGRASPVFLIKFSDNALYHYETVSFSYSFSLT